MLSTMMTIILYFLHPRWILDVPSLLIHLFQPLRDSVFAPGFPVHIRLRLLGLQLVNNLLFALIVLPRHILYRKRFKVISVPLYNTNNRIRCLKFEPTVSHARKKSLHIVIPGGGFVGCWPDSLSPWAQHCADATNSVVVVISYRVAPRYAFPTAHNDVRSIVAWLCANPKVLGTGVDTSQLTVSGFSAGGNLALGLEPPDGEANVWDDAGKLPPVAAWVGFFPPIDLRIPPSAKPKAGGMPKRDPLAFLNPLFNSYRVRSSVGGTGSSRFLNPYLRTETADLSRLPKNMLIIVAGIDILKVENLKFAKKLSKTMQEEKAKASTNVTRTLFMEMYESGFHGWVELPDWLLSKTLIEAKKDAYERAIGLINNALEEEHA